MKVEIYGSAESHTVRGATVNFNADSVAPVTELVAEVNPNGFDGRTGVDINKNGTAQSVAFGKTCYGGSANVTTGTLTEKYGGGAYDPQNVPAEVKSEVESKLTLETATPGDIVSFDCELGEYPLNSLSFPLAPIQDLHGYDSPWPAGGGKNLYNANALNNLSSSGVTVTVSNGTITFNGTATANAFFPVSGTGLPSGNYVFTFNNPVASSGVHVSFKTSGGQYFSDTRADAVNKSVSITGEPDDIVLYINSGTTLTDFVVKPQLETGSTPTSWTPYSNICPISGWDAVGIERTGFNVWDEETVGGWISATGSISSSTEAWVSKNYISVKPSAIYYLVNPNTGTAIRKVEYDANKNLIEGSVGWMVGQYTPSANARYIKIAQYLPQYGHDVSINYPSTDHNYHPYAGNRYAITLGQTVYGGTLDVTNGTMTVDRALVMLTWSNGYAAQDFETVTRKGFGLPNTVDMAKRAGSISDLAPFDSDSWTGDFAHFAVGGSQGMQAFVWLPKGTADTQTITICYPIATPIIITVDPVTIATIARQTNNVWADAGEISELKYYDGDIADTDIQTENGVLVTGDKLFYALSSPRTSSFTPTAVNTVQGENTMSANTGNIAVTYTSNWFDITPWIAWQGLTFSRNDVDAPNAGRDMAGIMHRGRVASKEKMNINTVQLTRAQSSKLQTLLYPETIMVRVTPYPRTNAAQILNMYSNNVKTTYVIHRESGEDLQSLSFPLIEN